MGFTFMNDFIADFLYLYCFNILWSNLYLILDYVILKFHNSGSIIFPSSYLEETLAIFGQNRDFQIAVITFFLWINCSDFLLIGSHNCIVVEVKPWAEKAHLNLGNIAFANLDLGSTNSMEIHQAYHILYCFSTLDLTD